jgi:dTDP-4-amino-4,6-dideoxygalactose transaminase
MSNVIAGVVRGQLLHLEEHIAQKKAIYMRYREGLRGLPVSMNPYDGRNSEPNFWLSCMLIAPEAMCVQERGALKAQYVPEQKKSCPTEILEILSFYNAEGRPIWKPMHMQPVYSTSPFVCGMKDGKISDVGADLFQRGLCLPSDNKMTPDEQDVIIELIRRCFE